MPSIEVGADVRMKRALNCWPWVWSLTHSPDAVIHSPAEIVAAWPMTVTRSRWPRAFARRTQKPFSLLWKVTRSTKPASTSWVDGSCCGLICVAAVGASPPNRIWRPALRSRSSSATQCPRVLSIGDRPLVGNRPAIQILGSLEAACDDGAIAAVGLITQGRPADSFGLSERCLLGDRIFLMSPRLVDVQAEVPIRTPRGAKARSQRSRRVAETRFDRTAWGAASSNHTISTIQSSRTAETVVAQKQAVCGGILPPIFNAPGLC
jgi:hypothetical protein